MPRLGHPLLGDGYLHRQPSAQAATQRPENTNGTGARCYIGMGWDTPGVSSLEGRQSDVSYSVDDLFLSEHCKQRMVFTTLYPLGKNLGKNGPLNSSAYGFIPLATLEVFNLPLDFKGSF